MEPSVEHVIAIKIIVTHAAVRVIVLFFNLGEGVKAEFLLLALGKFLSFLQVKCLEHPIFIFPSWSLL